MKRKYIVNIFIGIGIVTLVGGYLFGIFSKKSEEDMGLNSENVQEVVDYTNESKNDIDKEENSSLSNENNSSNEDEINDFDGGLEDIPEQEVDESQLPKSYEEKIGKELTKKTSKIVYDFIKIYHNYNGDDASKYIEESKKYMTDDLYYSLIEDVERPTHMEYYREFVSAEISGSNDFKAEHVDEAIPYIAHVKGKVTDVLEEETKDTTDIYIIILVKDGDEYKVGEVQKNVPFY